MFQSTESVAIQNLPNEALFSWFPGCVSHVSVEAACGKVR